MHRSRRRHGRARFYYNAQIGDGPPYKIVAGSLAQAKRLAKKKAVKLVRKVTRQK